MLHIFPNCNPVRLKETLMNQTWENGEKPNFGPEFGQFDSNLGFKIYSVNITSIRR